MYTETDVDVVDMVQQLLFFLACGFDVSHESLVFGALHGRAFEEPPVLLDIEVAPVFLCHLQEFLARLHVGVCGWCGKAVPRTGLLASVAAVDGVAHRLLGQC